MREVLCLIGVVGVGAGFYALGYWVGRRDAERAAEVIEYLRPEDALEESSPEERPAVVGLTRGGTILRLLRGRDR